MTEKSPSTIEVYVFLSPNIERILSVNRVSLSELLWRQEKIQVSETNAVNPIEGSVSSTREVATVLIASAALVASLTPALSRIIEGITGAKVMVKEAVLEPALVAKNEGVNSDAPRLLKWVERPLNSEFKIKGPLGIEISSRTS